MLSYNLRQLHNYARDVVEFDGEDFFSRKFTEFMARNEATRYSETHSDISECADRSYEIYHNWSILAPFN